MPHTLTHVRVQWVANPLSGHVYFVLFTRVDQVRDPALHRIEQQTSRFKVQRLSLLNQVGDVITTQTRANIARNAPTARATSYSDAGLPRRFTNTTGQKIKMNSAQKKFHIHLCDVVMFQRRPILLLHSEQRADIETMISTLTYCYWLMMHRLPPSSRVHYDV